MGAQNPARAGQPYAHANRGVCSCARLRGFPEYCRSKRAPQSGPTAAGLRRGWHCLRSHFFPPSIFPFSQDAGPYRRLARTCLLAARLEQFAGWCAVIAANSTRPSTSKQHKRARGPRTRIYPGWLAHLLAPVTITAPRAPRAPRAPPARPSSSAMAMLNEASLSPADAHAHANATTPTHSKAAAMASATTMLTTKTPFSIEHILFQNLNSASNNNYSSDTNGIAANTNNYAPKSSRNAVKSARSAFAHDNNPHKHPSQHSHPPQSHPPASASASATATARSNQAASGYAGEDYGKSMHSTPRLVSEFHGLILLQWNFSLKNFNFKPI